MRVAANYEPSPRQQNVFWQPAATQLWEEIPPAIQHRSLYRGFFLRGVQLRHRVGRRVHYDLMRQEYEAQRQCFLENLGVEILRFENRAVFENGEGMLETIREA